MGAVGLLHRAASRRFLYPFQSFHWVFSIFPSENTQWVMEGVVNVSFLFLYFNTFYFLFCTYTHGYNRPFSRSALFSRTISSNAWILDFFSFFLPWRKREVALFLFSSLPLNTFCPFPQRSQSIFPIVFGWPHSGHVVLFLSPLLYVVDPYDKRTFFPLLTFGIVHPCPNIAETHDFFPHVL